MSMLEWFFVAVLGVLTWAVFVLAVLTLVDALRPEGRL